MLPAIYQSNFHPTAFLLGKNERKTYTTLIRRMHSLGRGEGRAGLLSDSKYMHWLQDEVGLGSRFEWKLCGGQCSFLRPSEDRSRREVVRCHWSSPYMTMPVCFRFVLWRPATRENKRKKKEERKKERKIEIETEREREKGTTITTTTMDKNDISRDMIQSTLNDILRNPSPPQKKSHGRSVFLNPDFVNTLWHCYYRMRSIWG